MGCLTNHRSYSRLTSHPPSEDDSDVDQPAPLRIVKRSNTTSEGTTSKSSSSSRSSRRKLRRATSISSTPEFPGGDGSLRVARKRGRDGRATFSSWAYGDDADPGVLSLGRETRGISLPDVDMDMTPRARKHSSSSSSLSVIRNSEGTTGSNLSLGTSGLNWPITSLRNESGESSAADFEADALLSAGSLRSSYIRAANSGLGSSRLSTSDGSWSQSHNLPQPPVYHATCSGPYRPSMSGSGAGFFPQPRGQHGYSSSRYHFSGSSTHAPDAPLVLVPFVTVTPYRPTAVDGSPGPSIWAAVEIETRLLRPVDAFDATRRLSHGHLVPFNFQPVFGGDHGGYSRFGYLHDMKLEVLPADSSSIVQVIGQSPSPINLFPGSQALLVAHVTLQSSSSAPTADKTGTQKPAAVSKSHVRSKSDDLMEDLEDTLGTSTIEYLQVRLTYNHSAFPANHETRSDTGASTVTSGTNLQTTCSASIPKVNPLSPWCCQGSGSSGIHDFSVSSLTHIVACHWGDGVAAELEQRMAATASHANNSQPGSGLKDVNNSTTKHKDGASPEAKQEPSPSVRSQSRKEERKQATGLISSLSLPSIIHAGNHAKNTGPRSSSAEQTSTKSKSKDRSIWNEVRRLSHSGLSRRTQSLNVQPTSLATCATRKPSEKIQQLDGVAEEDSDYFNAGQAVATSASSPPVRESGCIGKVGGSSPAQSPARSPLANGERRKGLRSRRSVAGVGLRGLRGSVLGEGLVGDKQGDGHSDRSVGGGSGMAKKEGGWFGLW